MGAGVEVYTALLRELVLEQRKANVDDVLTI